jgi:hypothetical protein
MLLFWTGSSISTRTRFVGGGDKFIPRAINYYPRYSHKLDAEDYEDFCRVKMMLHHPHLELNDLHVIDGETVSWQEAYEHCQIFHAGLHDEEFEDLDPKTRLQGEVISMLLFPVI